MIPSSEPGIRKTRDSSAEAPHLGYSVKADWTKMILQRSGASFSHDGWRFDILMLYTRNLADIDDRGKLNLAEFHVAMGLIFRSMSGNLFRSCSQSLNYLF